VRVHRCQPGLRSYSLGNLCAHYGIEFERHHRAMRRLRAITRPLLDGNTAMHGSGPRHTASAAGHAGHPAGGPL